ncbi:MAG: YigZ family protein [Lachnospiraceae bacterium]|jgi:uncharacterized YigZ family protein|nr:YigZ family protein [Lachnospiraceae bacterium]
MESYRTIETRGEGSYEEKKSRFLGVAIPTKTEEEVQAALQEEKKKYYDAKHHCYACILGEKGELRRFSDDGEPQGTAGKPILTVLEGQNLRNVCIIVTRYFGGTLLGTGGLTRAYGEAAKRAVEAAGPLVMQPGKILRITMDYSLLDRVNWYLKKQEIKTLTTAYTEKAREEILVREDQLPALTSFLSQTGSGSIQADIIKEGFFGFGET